MIKLLIGFIGLLTAVILGAAFSQDPGYVFITIFQYRLETTVTAFLIALLFLFVLLHQLLCAIKAIKNIPAKIRAKRAIKALKNLSVAPNQITDTAYRLYKLNDLSGYICFYQKLSRKQQKQPDVLAYYAYFINENHHHKAEKMVRKSLQKNYHESLITVYGQLFEGSDEATVTKDMRSAIIFAETLEAEHPHDPALHLCLGRLNKTARLWGKAQYHLKESLSLQPTPEAYQVLATIYITLGNKDAACLAYKQGLELSLHTRILAKG